MREQKFKQGDLVRVLFGHPIYGKGHGWDNPGDMCPEQVGKLAIIEGSYWDLFSYMFPKTEQNRDSHIDDYSIIWVDTGYSEAWKHTNQLQLVLKASWRTSMRVKIIALVKTRIVYPYKRWRSRYKLCFKIRIIFSERR